MVVLFIISLVANVILVAILVSQIWQRQSVEADLALLENELAAADRQIAALQPTPILVPRAPAPYYHDRHGNIFVVHNGVAYYESNGIYYDKNGTVVTDLAIATLLNAVFMAALEAQARDDVTPVPILPATYLPPDPPPPIPVIDQGVLFDMIKEDDIIPPDPPVVIEFDDPADAAPIDPPNALTGTDNP